jgi:hypothetical protein
MRVCSNCRQPAIEGKRFCTRCGTYLQDEGSPEPGYVRPVRARREYRTVAFGTVGAALLVGIGLGAWFLVANPASRANAQSPPSSHPVTRIAPQAQTGSPGTTGSPAISGTAAPDSSTAGAAAPSEVTSSPGGVVIASGATGDATASQVAAFLDEYFTAINTHNYQAYEALLSPQAQGVTQAQFDTGYGSTTDSSETLRAIFTSSNGDSVANVTFTSHQSSAQSATNSTCTAWNISLYLVPSGGSGYLIDTPPAGYHAKYTTCG